MGIQINGYMDTERLEDNLFRTTYEWSPVPAADVEAFVTAAAAQFAKQLRSSTSQ